MKERQTESTPYDIGVYPMKFLGESDKFGYGGGALFNTVISLRLS
jgi:hypothetical protein